MRLLRFASFHPTDTRSCSVVGSIEHNHHRVSF
ncbi:unnamed protein product [Haemonchus placei]|uniref:Uncharacterized protein n=1 Tax=Haemonchus placei TaxID=6290 RepID=A0A0N4VUM9_HAEPC|nr:unnamed protein product [Haemonchus placei]